MAAVHPRARGEHENVALDFVNRGGSSPRTRGTSAGGRGLRDCRRFIPAHAGNIKRRASRTPPWPVHPRARGEHSVVETAFVHFDGSSPRTRGTWRDGRPGGAGGRFIPAHAGNILDISSRYPWMTVHPRARGEHVADGVGVDALGGSSPRTRGTSRRCSLCRADIRFIPAHAGNIHEQRDRRRGSPVHPRARGEHLNQTADYRTNFGSSPRTRGTWINDARTNQAFRFIPAHAGNIQYVHCSDTNKTVHPRPRKRKMRVYGSSPRTRGTFQEIQQR